MNLKKNFLGTCSVSALLAFSPYAYGMGSGLTRFFASICAINATQDFGGQNTESAACPGMHPSEYKDFISVRSAAFNGLLPQIEKDIAAPPVALQQMLDDVAQANAAADTGRTRSSLSMAALVDTYVNAKVDFVSDQAAFGKEDVWRAPGDTAKARQGDCEDYAVLKYALLRNLGFPADKMWISTGLITDRQDVVRKGEGHAVLVVEQAGQKYVLDNLFRKEGAELPSLEQYKQTATYYPLMFMNAQDHLVAKLSEVLEVLDTGRMPPAPPARPANGPK